MARARTYGLKLAGANPDHQMGYHNKFDPSRVRVWGWLAGLKTEPLVETNMTPDQASEFAENLLRAARQAREWNKRNGHND